MATFYDFEAAELFAAMMNKPEPETDEDTEALQQQCIDQFGVDFYGLAEIVERLLPLCEHARTAFSGASARGFARNGAFICKVYDDDINPSEENLDG
jgi:hypothetical protein